MTAALVGAASCARCGGQLGRAAALCPACGTLLLPAASGRMLGTSSPLLAGVVRASATRRRIALVLDALPFVAAIVVGGLLVARGAYADLALLALLTVGLLAVSLALLVHRGRSLGRLLTRLRTVDSLTGLPVHPKRLVGRVGHGRRTARTLTARLAAGRDPLHTAPAALLGTDLAEGPAPEAALFGPSGPADARASGRERDGHSGVRQRATTAAARDAAGRPRTGEQPQCQLPRSPPAGRGPSRCSAWPTCPGPCPRPMFCSSGPARCSG